MAKSKHIEVASLRHKEKRRNIPTAELEPVMDEKDKSPIRLAYERRNRDLDPQLVCAARTTRIGQTLSFRPRRSTFRKKSTRRSWWTTCCGKAVSGGRKRTRRCRTF